MSTKKKMSYRQCSIKGCRKKSFEGDECKIHAQQKTSLLSADIRRYLSKFRYKAGVVFEKINKVLLLKRPDQYEK